MVEHFHIKFIDNVNPVKTFCQANRFSSNESDQIDHEIQELLSMKVITQVEHDPNEFISPIFTVPKKDGTCRLILNLKDLNQFIEYHHFKMDTLESVLKLVTPGCYFASVDLRHAYYSVPIAPEHKVKLRFIFKSKIYQFECLPNGISSAPISFTRLLKPVFASLRMLGITISGFIDDSIILAHTMQDCERNVKDTVRLITDVGFITHEQKSVLVPTQQIIFLGNLIDSVSMTVTLPKEKVANIVQACSELQNMTFAKIRQVARVLGLMVSTFSAVEFAPLHYRVIERQKILSLQNMKGDFDSWMNVCKGIKNELQWWIDNLGHQKRRLIHANPSLVITCDASNDGWGAVCEQNEIGGRWRDLEYQNHINYLELLAVSHALRSFCKSIENCHVQVRSDNTCAVTYLNNMGGRIEHLNALANDIWSWCCQKNIWLSATHIPGVDNSADKFSREFQDNTEWMLNTMLFNEIIECFGMPEIDLFASRLNKQLDRYVSWKPDPDAAFVDAFALNWSNMLIYAFPPFSLLGRLVQKVRVDAAEMVLVALLWVTQNWFTPILEMLIQDPLILKVKKQTLNVPGTNKVHPLVNKLHLMVCHISGIPSKAELYRKNLSKFSWLLGENPLRSNISVTSRNGFSSVAKGKVIFFKRLLNQ